MLEEDDRIMHLSACVTMIAYSTEVLLSGSFRSYTVSADGNFNCQGCTDVGPVLRN